MTSITDQPSGVTWEAFAEATATGDDSARRMGRELAAQTPPIALARRARHRKPNRRHIAQKTLTGLCLAGLLALTGAAGAAIQAITPQPAAAVTRVQLASVNWTAKTCAAYAAWKHHPTTRNLHTMITDSLNVPWHKPGSKYGLGSDIYELGGDVLAGKTQYVPRAARYIAKDCRP